MGETLVSVVIPTYNYGRFVRQAVDSALAQTYPHREVIVVDDGSTDDTKARLEPYGGGIRYVYQENQGLSAARNAGIRSARGRYVALLDADDLWHPQKLERQVAYLASHPEVALLAAESTRDLPAAWPVLPGASPPWAREVSLEQLAMCSRFGPSGVVIAKHCLGRVGLFDTSLRAAEDRDMWVRIANHFAVRILPDVLWYYRVHGNNMSAAARVMEQQEFKVIRARLASSEALRGRLLLRRRILARAGWAAALRYAWAGEGRTALARLLMSFVRWPLPFLRSDRVEPAGRVKLFGVVLLRMLKLKERPNSTTA